MVNTMNSITWYNAHAKYYAEQAERYIPKDQIDDFVQLLQNGSKILDAGCGSGRDSRVLQNKGMKVTGVDLSEELLKIARSNNRDISFINADLRALPFPDQSFEGVWSHASLVHVASIKDAELIIREFYRVLKTDGMLHIYTQASTSVHSAIEQPKNGAGAGRFFFKYVKEELRETLERVGFVEIKCSQFVDPFAKEKNSTIEWILYLGKKQTYA
jgi:ubiquinone/menaquinone biosynthesis C-methylase UbiE